MIIDPQEELKKLFSKAKEANEDLQILEQQKQSIVNSLVKMQGVEAYLIEKIKEEKEKNKIEKVSDNISVDSVSGDTVPGESV